MDRIAVCRHCLKVVDSDQDLPYFLPRPSLMTDQFDCGCEENESAVQSKLISESTVEGKSDSQ